MHPQSSPDAIPTASPETPPVPPDRAVVVDIRHVGTSRPPWPDAPTTIDVALTIALPPEETSAPLSAERVLGDGSSGTAAPLPAQVARPKKKPEKASKPKFRKPKVTFRIRSSEALPVALQRISLEQFDVALAGMTDPSVDRDVAVHEARKAMKRVRAVLRLARDEIGDDVYGAENEVLRDTARTLAGIRDSAVQAGAVRGLRKRYSHELSSGALRAVEERLMERHAVAAANVQPELVSEAVRRLRSARARYAAWPTGAEDQVDGLVRGGTPLRNEFAAVAPGLRRVYRRGQLRMADAYEADTPEAFHEWRKRIKYLRYQTEMLERAWPGPMKSLARSLETLAETLGEANDLAVLQTILRDDPDLCRRNSERRMLTALAEHTRRRTVDKMRPLGRRVYAETPDAFVTRIGVYWEAWRPAGGAGV